MKKKIMSKKRYKNYYDKELFEKYRFNIKSVDTSKKKTQEIRHETLVEIGVKKGDSVLDVGCGFGDLAGLFMKKKLPVKYMGFDVSEKFVSYSEKKYKKNNLKGMQVDFKVKDVFKDSISGKFDWVIISGFNLLTIKLIKKYFDICKKGVAVNFLSSYANKKNVLFPYRNPAKTFNLIRKKISPFITLRHDYLPHDFTIYIYKNAN